MSLMLHMGSEPITRKQISKLPVPAATETHFPLSNDMLLAETERSIAEAGLDIVKQEHGYDAARGRYFGLIEVHAKGGDGAALADSLTTMIGLRNSNDKSLAAGLCYGSRVFVCDNLAFDGEVNLSRRHTKHALRDLPGMIYRATSLALAGRSSQLSRYDRYLGTTISDQEAAALTIQGARIGAIARSKVMDVMSHWDKPPHAEFEGRDCWSLFNAFTETYKSNRIHDTVRRSQLLGGMLDQRCGIADLALAS